jgi:hypothetical protein
VIPSKHCSLQQVGGAQKYVALPQLYWERCPPAFSEGYGVFKKCVEGAPAQCP